MSPQPFARSSPAIAVFPSVAYLEEKTMRKLASIQTVNAVEPITNADAIENSGELALATGGEQPDQQIRLGFGHALRDQAKACFT
jgi:hypothetical protein